MKISIAASGSRGDVQPYTALGRALKAAGYSVQVLTTDDFATLVRGAGLEFRSIGSSIESAIQSDEWRSTLEKSSFLKVISQMRSEMKKRAHELAHSLPGLLEGSDLVLGGVSGMTGAFSAAEKLGIPIIQAYLFPITPTRAFPSPLTPTLPFGRVLNRFSFHAMQQMLWQSGRMADVITRQMLEMTPAPLLAPYPALMKKGLPVLYGYSKHVLPQPDDWADFIHVTGYWFLDTDSTWTPPPALADFLEAGTQPIYIGFGSMGTRDPEAMTRLAIDALALAGQRGVLASGWGGLSQADLPETVHMITSVPHSWLFPQMAAVVHHGGAGTTAAGLRAGVPSIITPFFGDQPFWGHRIAQLGVGPQPIAKRQLTAEKLADAITQAVTDNAMRQRATALGEKIRAEDGIQQAVTLIQRFTEQMPALAMS